MINRVILIGRLTRDPELRKTTTDTPVTSFILAVDNRNKNADGQKTTSFIPITVWNNQATNVCKYLHKGSLVSIDGRILQRNYDKKDGTKGYVLEVIADYVQFLESIKNNDEYKINNSNIKEDKENDKKNDNSLENENKKEESANISNDEISDDDLPF